MEIFLIIIGIILVLGVWIYCAAIWLMNSFGSMNKSPNTPLMKLFLLPLIIVCGITLMIREWFK